MYQLIISNTNANSKITKQCNRTARPAALPMLPLSGGDDNGVIVTLVILVAVGVSTDISDAKLLLVTVNLVLAMVGLGELGVLIIVTDEVSIDVQQKYAINDLK